jgi:dolichol kinase
VEVSWLHRKAVHLFAGLGLLAIAAMTTMHVGAFWAWVLAVLSMSFFHEDHKAFMYFASIGVVLYAFPMVVAYAAITALCIGDVAASVIHTKNKKKSIDGFLANFCVLSFLYFIVFGVAGVGLAAVAATVEVGSGHYDNFMIPMMVALVAKVMLF